MNDFSSNTESESDVYVPPESDVESYSTSDCDHPNRYQRENTFKCLVEGCKAAFSKNRKLINHLRKHTNERPFACGEPDCTKTYTNSSHLLRHKRVAHAQTKAESVPCPVDGCDHLLSNRSNLKRHIARRHDSQRKYAFQCTRCPLGFHRKRLLHQHMTVHTGKLPYNCAKCDTNFGLLSQLNRHRRTHTSYPCGYCDEKFERWSDMLKHRRLCEKFVCETCQKEFASKATLKAHRVTHTPRAERSEVFRCPRSGCGRSYLRKNNLQHHINKYHEHAPTSKQLPCPIDGCDAVLSRRQTLKNHILLHKQSRRPLDVEQVRAIRKDRGSYRKSIVAGLAGVALTEEQHREMIRGHGMHNI